jgi:hypothetical protein
MTIAILYEHPNWFKPLFAELERRRVPYERIPIRDHHYDPAQRLCPYSLIVNRISAYPSGGSHPEIILYVKQYLAYLASIGAKVINGYRSYQVGTSKAMQLDIFEQLGLRYPRARVIHHADQAVPAAAGLSFPIVVKPNVGGSGTGILKFNSLDELRLATSARALDLGIDHTALVQEFLPAKDRIIIRVELLDGKFLYALRLATTEDSFNYCPADGCNVENADLAVESYRPPDRVIREVQEVLAAAGADLGSVEYLTCEDDDQIYYYDINPLSNFVADATRVVGFDPFTRLVDYVLTRAAE